MVHYETSHNKLLNFIFYMSCLGIFQCVRDILQVTVLIDHPVASPLCTIEKIHPFSKIAVTLEPVMQL